MKATMLVFEATLYIYTQPQIGLFQWCLAKTFHIRTDCVAYTIATHTHTIGGIYYNWDLCNGVPRQLATSWISHIPKMTQCHATKWFNNQLSATMWPCDQLAMRWNGLRPRDLEPLPPPLTMTGGHCCRSLWLWYAFSHPGHWFVNTSCRLTLLLLLPLPFSHWLRPVACTNIYIYDQNNQYPLSGLKQECMLRRQQKTTHVLQSRI